MVTKESNQFSPQTVSSTTESFSLSDLSKSSTLTKNIQQDCIVTTYDKVKLVLMEYEDSKRHASNWLSYTGMALSFLIPSITAEFSDFFFLKAAFISAAFWLLAFSFSILSFFSITKRVRNRKIITVEYCANAIKNGNVH